MGLMNATTYTATVVGISGSPSARSKSRTLLEHALAALAERGATPSLIDLASLPADALLGRRRSDDVDDALARVSRATIVVASTPVYRATYSGLLKVFFDLFPINGLADKVAIAIATGGSPAHQLVIDHGLRPLFGSVGAITTPTGIYGTDSGFENGVPQRIADHAYRAGRIGGGHAQRALACRPLRPPLRPFTRFTQRQHCRHRHPWRVEAMPSHARPIAVFHEHPDWFRPLFAELERREIPYVRLDAAAHRYDPAERDAPYSLVFNRASPSAYLRGHGQTTFYTLHWLRHLERLGVPGGERRDGVRARAVEGDAARPAARISACRIRATRVINDPSQARAGRASRCASRCS